MRQVVIDKEKYLAELKRVEADIRALKAQTHKSGYESTFNHWKLFHLRAEAQRLYVFRTTFRVGKHDPKGGFYLQTVKYAKEPRVFQLPQPKSWYSAVGAPVPDHMKLTPEEIENKVLNGVPNWSDKLLKTVILRDETPEGKVEVVTF